VNSVASIVSSPHIRHRVTDFVRRASTEITPHDEKVAPALAEALPPGATVYVAHTPKATLEDVVRVSLKVQSLGLRASPHIVARRLPSEDALRDALAELRSAGVEQVLVIAGDREAPLGPFAHSLDVIDSGVIDDSGMRNIGVAGHPEGHKVVEPERLWEALHHKQAFGQRTGISVHIVTQFGFDPEAICDWVRLLSQKGISRPVHVGIAGPTSLMKLLRFAMQCGVGASLQSAAKNMRAVGNLARMATTPEEMIPALVRSSCDSDFAQIAQPHFFTFGGALATAQWIRAVSNGAFELRPDGKLELNV